MKRSPEQYFQEQNFSVDLPPDAKPGEFSEAERAFMEKYMGVDAARTLQSLGIAPPATAAPTEAKTSAAPVAAEIPAEESLDQQLRRETELLMVGFFLGEQEFVVPTLAVQEVIRFSPPAKLPAAPPFVAGVINLRGKVTPLIRLRDILDVNGERKGEDRFIIVCRRRGLQMGLMIERVHTMYRVPQTDIDWAVEARLGINVDFVSGLLKLNENLIGIVSVDRIIETVIRR